MKRASPATHLTHEELFGLALPPTGKPEALPAHLSECLRCSRLLQEWKSAVTSLAEEDEEAIARRPAADWRAAEEATLAAIRKTGRPGSRRRRVISIALGAAASLLFLALLLPRREPQPTVPANDAEAVAELSEADRADDALLRDASALARGEDAWLWDPPSREGEQASSPDGGREL
jgi:hypothetical protein